MKDCITNIPFLVHYNANNGNILARDANTKGLGETLWQRQTSRELSKWAPNLCSKIAKGLQSVKYSLLQYPLEEKIEKKSHFFRSFLSKFFWSPISGIVPKNLKETSKSLLNSISSPSRSSVAFNVSSSQLIELIKSVSSLVSKKVTTIVCGFLREAPTKKILKGIMTIETITEVLRECKYDRLNNSNI